MIKKGQSYNVLVACVVAFIMTISVTTHHSDQRISNSFAVNTIMVHAFSPNNNAEKVNPDSSMHHQVGTNPNPTVIQPEIVSRSTKTMRKSNTRTQLDWEQQILTELQQRIDEGFQYEPNDVEHDSYNVDNKNNNCEEEDFENCHAVFAGYRFTIEERQRLRSAHAEDDDTTTSSSTSSYVAP